MTYKAAIEKAFNNMRGVPLTGWYKETSKLRIESMLFDANHWRAEAWRWRKLALVAICGFGGAVTWMVVTAVLGGR